MPSLPSLPPTCYIRLRTSPKRNLPKRNLQMSSQSARATIADAPLLLRENVGSIAVITLNRPAQRNTLSEEVIASLQAALNEISTDKAIRAVVIASQARRFPPAMI